MPAPLTTDTPPAPEAAARAFFTDMESALTGDDMPRFYRLAAERRTLFLQWRDERGRTTLPAGLVSDLVGQNRRWQNALGERCARLRAQIARDRVRRQTCRSLGQAYGGAIPDTHCVVRRG